MVCEPCQETDDPAESVKPEKLPENLPTPNKMTGAEWRKAIMRAGNEDTKALTKSGNGKSKGDKDESGNGKSIKSDKDESGNGKSSMSDKDTLDGNGKSSMGGKDALDGRDLNEIPFWDEESVGSGNKGLSYSYTVMSKFEWKLSLAHCWVMFLPEVKLRSVRINLKPLSPRGRRRYR